MISFKDTILRMHLREEESRILFVLNRDGDEGFKTFVVQTEKIYKKHIVKKLYPNHKRAYWIRSYLDFRRVKNLFD